jgi:hypothetical protein
MSTAEDLSFVREIAEEGRMQPLKGGPFLVLWGVVTCVGLTVTALIAGNIWDISPAFIGLFWVLFAGIGMIGNVHFGRKLSMEVSSLTLAQKIEKNVWILSGSFIGLFVAMIYVLLAINGERYAAAGVNINTFFSLISPLAFGVYSIAFCATAVAARAKWLWAFVGISLMLSAASMLVVLTIWQFVVTIAGVIAVTILPGVIMIQKNKKVPV